ncbi:glycosyltransferase family 2 protein [Salipiger sp. 1_MG-2023]|uniref:glycosyltransferase family 2 protein n=1 Tax=Salipiger sp. 1_MG-2023 TaxID=3062665 RepID=UPI0026E4348C|nr:glycosyltransferase family 2 protein [Salipiger sp. 1_MG-2023]MDO6585789.1 glycosyltransferase family 2 protein [Salipiger sp. 1_MG-2023]
MAGIVAVLCVRNEAAFLLDWLAHHLVAGVSHVVALSNDCEDGTDLMLQRLQELGHVTHIRNDGPHEGGVQFAALRLADDCPAVREADWLLPLDVDEFVNVHVGNRTLPALIKALPRANAITLTWRLFGNAGVLRYRDTPVTQQFTRAAPADMVWPWRAAMFKTLYRNDGTYRKLGVHRPRDPDPSRIETSIWYDGEGRALEPHFRTKRIFSTYGRSNYKLAQLNHYPLGAMESFILKADRGRAVHSDQTLGMDYWTERNFAAVEDKTVLALADRVAEQRKALAQDAPLASLHRAAVAWRHERFERLMLEESCRALMGRLMMTPASQPLSPGLARILHSHANRAQGHNHDP